MGLFDKLTGRVADFIDGALLPDELRTVLLRAQKALTDSDWDEALRLLDALDEIRPGLTRASLLRGEALMGRGEPGRAAEALRKAANQRPEPRILHLLALALERAGELRGARDTLREAMEQNPDPTLRANIHRALGGVHTALGRPDRAALELRKALKALPESDETDEVHRITVDLARALILRGELSEARTLIESVPTDDSAEDLSDDALRVLGRLDLLEGRSERALPSLEAFLERHPDDLDARIDTARAALSAHQQPLAAKHLEEALSRAPEQREPEIRALLGRVALELGQIDDALDHLGRALEARPDHAEALGSAGWAALGKAEALRAENAPTEDSDALINLAEAHFGRLDLLAASSPLPKHGLGRCRMLREDWIGARRLLGEAIGAGAGNDARLDLGLCCLETQDPAAAIATLSEAVTGEDDAKAEALLRRAYALLAPKLSIPETDSRDLAAWAACAADFRDWIARTPALLGFLPRVGRLAQSIDAPLDIAVLGEFNAGKSTLVNAVIGEAIVPTGVLPTTAHINVMRFGPRRAARLHMKDGGLVEVPYGEVKRRVKADDGPRKIDHIEYLYPHPDLRRVHFWDTPGFNAIDPDHERHAQDALERAEAIVWLLDAGQVLAESERVLIDTVHHGKERLIVAINKIDRLEDRVAQSAQLFERVETILGDGVGAIFPMSGLEGLRARQSGDDAALEASGLGALLQHLQQDVYERVAQLKSIEAEREIGALIEAMGDHTEARTAQLDGLQAQLDAIREGLRVESENLRGRFIEEERRRLQEAMESTITGVAREIEGSLRPAAGLGGALLTRMALAEEDTEFVLDLLLERLDALLDASHRRVEWAIIDAEQRLAQGFEQLIHALDPTAAGQLRRRLEGHLLQSRVLRALLTERVYGRYRAIARGRVTAPEVPEALAKAARRDTERVEHKAALRRLAPDIDGAMLTDLSHWAQEYFTAALRFCDVTSIDLRVMSIEIQALTSGLDKGLVEDR